MPSGVPVTGTITTYAGGTYATIDPTTGIDGWRSVATTTVRNAITTARRRQGMAVWVQADGSLWTLNAAPWAGDDTDWTQFTGGGAGTVTTVSVTTANGVSGTVATATTTPAITIALGAITPTSVNASGTMAGSNLSGTNTGDQTITLTGDVTGSGVGTFSATIKTDVGLAGSPTTTTQSPGDNSTKLATTAFVAAAITASTQTITLTGDVTGTGTGTFATTFGTIAPHTLIANTASGTAAPTGVTLTSLLDVAISSDQATLIARSASAWASLPPGANGLPLRSFGSAANLAYSDTGLKITQHYGDIIVPAGTSGTITMDLSLGDWQVPAAVTGAFSLSASNITVGQQFTVVLAQGSGSYAVTWFSGITWFGSPYTAPTMPNTSGAKLAATFKTMSSSSFNGWWLGNTAT